MVTINICGNEHICDSSYDSWINEQYHNRKRTGADFWFIITIDTSDIKLTLSSANAQHGKGKPYSHFNHKERQIIDMWNDIGVKQENNVSILLRFMNKLKSAVS